MVLMSHLWGLEGPVTGQSQTPRPHLWHHSWRLPCSDCLASPIGLGSCEHHGQHRSTLDVSPVSPGSDPAAPRLLVWPGQSQAEWSRLQASKLRSCSQLLDGTGNSRLTWLPGYQKCSLASPKSTVAPWFPLISREIESSGPQRKNWWCSIPMNQPSSVVLKSPRLSKRSEPGCDLVSTLLPAPNRFFPENRRPTIPPVSTDDHHVARQKKKRNTDGGPPHDVLMDPGSDVTDSKTANSSSSCVGTFRWNWVELSLDFAWYYRI